MWFVAAFRWLVLWSVALKRVPHSVARKYPLTVEEIYWIHERVVHEWDLDHDDTAHPNPDVIFQRILDAAAPISDPYLQAATVLRRVITAHCFEDGNKRTAWLAATKILVTYDEYPSPDRSEAAKILRHTARYDADEVAAWLRTGSIDRSKLRSDG